MTLPPAPPAWQQQPQPHTAIKGGDGHELDEPDEEDEELELQEEEDELLLGDDELELELLLGDELLDEERDDELLDEEEGELELLLDDGLLLEELLLEELLELEEPLLMPVPPRSNDQQPQPKNARSRSGECAAYHGKRLLQHAGEGDFACTSGGKLGRFGSLDRWKSRT